jgi:hypothetical protein
MIASAIHDALRRKGDAARRYLRWERSRRGRGEAPGSNGDRVTVIWRGKRRRRWEAIGVVVGGVRQRRVERGDGGTREGDGAEAEHR